MLRRLTEGRESYHFCRRYSQFVKSCQRAMNDLVFVLEPTPRIGLSIVGRYGSDSLWQLHFPPCRRDPGFCRRSKEYRQ
jgi:hypothetical protein